MDATERARIRYHLATMPDSASQTVIDMCRDKSYAEFDRWLAGIKAAAWREGVRYAFNHSVEADYWTPADITDKNPYLEND